MSFGAGASKGSTSSSGWGQGENITSAQSQSTQGVWGDQAQYLGNMYNQATGQAGMAMDATNAAMPGIGQSAGRLMNQGPNAAAMGAYGDIASGQGGMAALDSYSNRVGENFNNNIMPGINQQAIGANAYGGSRQGVAQGVAAGQARQQIQDFAGDQYNQDQNRRLQAAGGMGNLSEQSRQGQLGAMGQLPGLQSMYMNPMNQLGGVIGGPTVLGQSQSSADSYGYDMNSSESRGRNSSWNFSGGAR